MEDVLDLYAEPYDAQRPQVCVDEVSYQLLEDVHEPLPTAPSQPRKQDYEYVRRGTCNLFVMVEPQAGRRHVAVTDQRTAQDFAHFLRDLVEVHYPDATVIRLVTDNLNTHSPAALYETFDAATAQRLTRKIEWHYTPKHASWLNMAEIEIGVLKRQCLGRRIAAQDELAREVSAWQAQRNLQRATITWTFTTQAARTKLARHYELESV
jgi:hypothetical protein